MTAFKLAAAPQIPDACLIAARRAVYAELWVYSNNTPGVTWGEGSDSPEAYSGGPIIIRGHAGLDIGPYIDAAACEAIVVHASMGLAPRRRRWWEFWR